jgi:hypothetical protein
MDNLGVRLPVDATTKSKFKAKGLTSQMKEEILLIPEKCIVKLSGIGRR